MSLKSFLVVASCIIVAINGQISSTTTADYVCGGATLSSSNNIAVYLKLDYNSGTVDITLEGPESQFFAVGFGNNVMSGTYIIVVDGDNAASVSERTLGIC